MIFRTLGTAVLSTFLILPCTLHAQGAVDAAIVEGADVFFYYNFQEMKNSAWSQAVEAQQTPEMKEAAEEQFAALTQATGLTQDDISSMVFSMDIDGIDFTAQDPAELESAQALLALDTLEPLTLENIQNGISTLSETTQGPAPKVTLTEVDGIPVLELMGTETPGGVDKAYAALSEDGKTALWSFNMASIKNGLGRLATGTPATMTEEMTVATTAFSERELFMTVVLPAAVRQKLQQGIQDAAAQGGMGAMLMPFASTRSLLVGVDAAENLDLNLSLDVGTPGNAQQAAGMIQSMLPMLMMGMQEQAEPEVMNLMNKFKVSAEENRVTMGLSLTPEESAMISAQAASAQEALPSE